MGTWCNWQNWRTSCQGIHSSTLQGKQEEWRTDIWMYERTDKLIPITPPTPLARDKKQGRLEWWGILWDHTHFEWHWWLSARLQYLQCISNGNTAVLHQDIDTYHSTAMTAAEHNSQVNYRVSFVSIGVKWLRYDSTTLYVVFSDLCPCGRCALHLVACSNNDTATGTTRFWPRAHAHINAPGIVIDWIETSQQ